MKNHYMTIPAAGVLILAVLGCSSLNPFSEKRSAPANGLATNSASNKTLTDKAVDTAVGEEKIGIPECDEVMDILAAYLNDPEDNFVVKAGKSLVANKIKEGIRTSLEENKADKAEMAKDCTEMKRELQKAIAEQERAANK